MKWPRIEHYRRVFARGNTPRFTVESFFVDGSWLLTDRNHSCCAIYLDEPRGWEVRLASVAAPSACFDLLSGLG